MIQARRRGRSPMARLIDSMIAALDGYVTDEAGGVTSNVGTRRSGERAMSVSSGSEPRVAGRSVSGASTGGACMSVTERLRETVYDTPDQPAGDVGLRRTLLGRAGLDRVALHVEASSRPVERPSSPAAARGSNGTSTAAFVETMPAADESLRSTADRGTSVTVGGGVSWATVVWRWGPGSSGLVCACCWCDAWAWRRPRKRSPGDVAALRLESREERPATSRAANAAVPPASIKT